MAKLTKAQIATHKAACELLQKDVLTYDEREFVLNNWQESATHINSAAGAFFTPLDMAYTFAVEVSGSAAEGARILDLCAGIGCLAFAVYHRNAWGRDTAPALVCVEKNPDYVAVGRKVLPEATWICGDVFDLPADLGRFDFAISNPPFGSGGPLKGVTLDLNVVAVASELADYGVFILPQMSAPFRYSGERHYVETPGAAYTRFQQKTGIPLGPSCGIDCDYFRDDWRGVAPKVEVCLSDFAEWRAARAAIALAS
jgi:predicted RNA methylase